MSLRFALAMILLGALTSFTTACGVRGPLEQPPSAKTAEGEPVLTEEEKPHRGFILDRILD
jgi:predicted small lipoprotein YifL